CATLHRYLYPFPTRRSSDLFHDTVDVLLPLFHFFFEVGDHGPLRGDFPERLGHFPRALFCEQGNLLVGEARELIGCRERAHFLAGQCSPALHGMELWWFAGRNAAER